MKRSEAAKLATGQVARTFGLKFFEEINPDNFLERLEMLGKSYLKYFEELGMLPPQNPNVDNYSIAMGSNANFWEEESED